MIDKIKIIELLEFLDEYVLIKLSDSFPNVEEGSDIDLLIYDYDHISKKIYEFYENNLFNHFELSINKKDSNCHFDFLNKDKLILRLDCHFNFKSFKKIKIKNYFITRVFQNRQKKSFSEKFIYIPSEIDDLTIRYFEYLEYFDRYPKKLNHFEFITKNSSENKKTELVNNAHRFISFNHSYDDYLINKLYFPRSRKSALKNMYRNLIIIIKGTFKIIK